MTAEQYAAQNALGFEGDSFLQKEIQQLIDKYKINLVIETGTYLGATANKLSEMATKVITIEINPEYYSRAKRLLSSKSNVTLYHEDTLNIFQNIIAESASPNTLFYLDDHWRERNPLLEELSIIAKSEIKPVLAIHDFKVPNHPELGFDSYGGQDYDWNWIKNSIDAIYGENGYEYHYNSEAEGAKRGVIFIEPKTY